MMPQAVHESEYVALALVEIPVRHKTSLCLCTRQGRDREHDSEATDLSEHHTLLHLPFGQREDSGMTLAQILAHRTSECNVSAAPASELDPRPTAPRSWQTAAQPGPSEEHWERYVYSA